MALFLFHPSIELSSLSFKYCGLASCFCIHYSWSKSIEVVVVSCSWELFRVPLMWLSVWGRHYDSSFIWVVRKCCALMIVMDGQTGHERTLQSTHHIRSWTDHGQNIESYLCVRSKNNHSTQLSLICKEDNWDDMWSHQIEWRWRVWDSQEEFNYSILRAPGGRQ